MAFLRSCFLVSFVAPLVVGCGPSESAPDDSQH